MVSNPTVIEIKDIPELIRIVEEIQNAHEPRLLQRNGEALAIITPIDVTPKRAEHHVCNFAAHEGLRHSAGGWEGIVDVDEFKKNNRESRDLSSRPPVSL